MFITEKIKKNEAEEKKDRNPKESLIK